MRRALVLLAVLMLFAPVFFAASLGPNDEWPQYRANSTNTGYADTIAALTNQELWKATLGGPTYSSPTVAADRVYIGDNTGMVWAFKAETGEKVWSFKTNGSIESSPTYLDDRIFVGSNDNRLYALNATSGALVWSFKTGGSVKSSVSVGVLANQKKVLVFGSYDNKLYGLDTSGKMLWNFSATSFIHGKPGIFEGIAYTCTCDRSLYGIDIETGQKVTAIPFNDYSAASPAIYDGYIYGTARGGKVFAVSIQEKAVKWEYNTNQTLETSATATFSGVMFGNSVGDFYSLELKTGQKRWSFKADGSISSSAAFVGSAVHFGDDSGKLYKLDGSNGTKLWSFQADGAISSSPAVARGRIFFGTEKGTIYAIGAPKPIVKILSPLPWSHVKGKVKVQIEVTGADITSVEVLVDIVQSHWAKQPDASKPIWEATFDSKKLVNGEVKIQVEVFNATGAARAEIYVIVDNPKTPSFIPAFDFPFVLGITIFASVVMKLVHRTATGRRER